MRNTLCVVGILVASVFAPVRFATGKEVIRFATQQDPIFIAAVYPIRSGKVSSDLVNVEFSFLPISSLGQAPMTREYDVIHIGSLGVVRAKEQGIPLSIIAISLRYPDAGDGANIWVKEDSPFKTIEDLKGRTIATYGLHSSGFNNVRQVLALKYGFDVSLDGGHFRFVELPAPTLPAALESGRVDAATLIHAQIFKAKQSGGVRPLVKIQEDIRDLLGVRVPSLVLAAYDDRLASKPEAYKAFSTLLQDSIAYLKANPDEVFKAVGEQAKIDPAYFKMWFSEFGEIPYSLTKEDVLALRKSWEASVRIKTLSKMPEETALIWRGLLSDGPRSR